MKEVGTSNDVAGWYANHPGIVDIHKEEAEVKIDRILKGMGMALSDADNYLINLISHLIEECKNLFKPQAAFVLLFKPDFVKDQYRVFIQDTGFNTGKIVFSFLKKSIALVLFSCTCGNTVENYSRKLMKEGNSLEGLIVDLIGSELAEWIAEEVHNYIEEAIKPFDFGVSNRYSPGYCNWPVSEQHKLFALLGENNCGIKLTPTSLMLPIKSVSGMFGIGPGIRRLAYKCNICDDENCIMRGK